ncbi:neural cell adhesion molecule 1 [Galendromus occidentalis]|uniref:Neural cell adhesion molecule 1 n=1 Tax=Galendromus occidentalis TaxID=34638 RepID=A0AAJ7L8R1_9ACAR|nr:neural cell adhesion molecule 1 [Galendromus occidentalis]
MSRPSIVYTAVVRGKVALPCSIEPPGQDDEVALVLWYKDDIPAPIFTIDARGSRDLESARQTSVDQLGTRAVFNIANKPSFLQLDPVNEADGGEYRCRVDFKRARSINTVINLRVIVPPGEPAIFTESGKTLRGLAGPFNEGDPLTLTCKADIGKPRPTLHWMQENRVIDEKFYFDVDRNIVRNTLEIPQLNRSDLLAVLTCQAANNNITSPSQTSITLDLNLKPLDISIQPPERSLSAGKSVELVCTSSGSRPPAVLTWWKGDQQVKATKEDFAKGGLSTSTSVLVFTPTADDHKRVIACRAENPSIPGSALEQNWRLDVHYSPRMKLTLGSNLRESDIQEGRDVYLDCKIRANPLTSEVIWEFEGQELQTDKNKGIIVSSSSLVLQKVQRYQRGWYTCSATNREGVAISNRLYLRVKYSPRCKETQRRVYGVSLHETTSIRCDLDADPESEIEYTWAFNNSQGKRADLNPVTASAHRTSRSIINYKPMTEQDYGELLCYGTNEVGQQLVPCVYQVVAAGTPDPLENCSQVNATESGFTIECTEGPWNGGVAQSQVSFVAEVFNVDTQEYVTNVTVEGSPVFLFKELPNAENNDAGYRVQISALNHKGRSSVTLIIAHVLNASKYTQPPRLMVIRPVIGIILGLIITIAFVGFFVFTLLKCKKYQAQNKALEPQKNSKKSVTVIKADSLNSQMGPSPLSCSESLFDLERGPDILQPSGLASNEMKKNVVSTTVSDYCEDDDRGFSIDMFYKPALAGTDTPTEIPHNQTTVSPALSRQLMEQQIHGGPIVELYATLRQHHGSAAQRLDHLRLHKGGLSTATAATTAMGLGDGARGFVSVELVDMLSTGNQVMMLKPPSNPFHCDIHYAHDVSIAKNNFVFAWPGAWWSQWAPGIYCLGIVFILCQLNTQCIVNGNVH